MSNFHSQCGEDKWLDENWSTLGLPDVGYYVEVGGGDGIHLSNTVWLEEAKGWSGLIIEGDPRNIIKPRPRTTVDRSVVGPAGKVSFGLHPTDSFLSGIERGAMERIEVDAIPLSEIFRRHEVAKVDFISIDVEGTEVEVWRTLDLTKIRPTIACIELFTWKLPDRSRELVNVMHEDGYKLIHRTELNGLFRDGRV